jgi:hypothetical protein
MKKIFIIILVLLGIISCDDEKFLTEEPHSVSDASFYKSETGAIQGLNAAYDILQLGENVERIEFLGTVCSGDAMVGGEPGGGDQVPMQQAMRFETAPENLYMANYWQSMYRGIYRANLLIYYLGSPLEDFDETLRTKILGEAYFLRGLFHFKLQIFYGGYPQMQSTFSNQLKGVPYVDRLLSSEEWADISRPELEVTWTGIEDDFKTAADMLPLRRDVADSDKGRATKGAAQAMLAKTHLYQNEFSEAYQYAAEVINSNEYWLMGGSVEPGPFQITRTSKEGNVTVDVPGYKYIYQPEANNCPEDVFSVQHFNEHSGSYPQGQEGNLIPQYYGVRRVMTYDNSEENLASTEYYWGFILPTTYFIETAYKEVGCEDGSGNILDPRFKLGVIGPSDSVPYYYNNDDRRARFPDSAQFHPWGNWPSTGYATWKYFTDPYFNNSATTLGDHPQNTKYLRYADVLLIGAEAALQSGNTSDALTWVNMVRARARNSGNTGYPQAYTSITLEQIYAERRVELAFEGHQFFDIVRTGRAQQILKQDALEFESGNNPETGQTALQQFGRDFTVGKNELFAIPQQELTLIKNEGFTQNPGYN